MTFYVYHDPPTSWARIHYADCRDCNHGQGQHGMAGGTTGKWYSFATYQEAEDFARKTNAKDWGPCGTCHPH
jgi:hypothetical protein